MWCERKPMENSVGVTENRILCVGIDAVIFDKVNTFCRIGLKWEISV